MRPGIRLDAGTAEILRSSDIALVIRSAQEAAAGIETGKLARSHASDQEIRALGQQQVEEYSKVQEQLTKLAAARAITLPTTPDTDGIRANDKLALLSGGAFDKAYLSDSLKVSEAQAKRFAKEVKSGKDSQIQAFAAQTGPDLQRMAEKVKAIRAKGAGGSSS